jgi:hypothetical protein
MVWQASDVRWPQSAEPPSKAAGKVCMGGAGDHKGMSPRAPVSAIRGAKQLSMRYRPQLPFTSAEERRVAWLCLVVQV